MKDEEQAIRKVKLRVDEVQGKNCLTNFHGIDFTTDKLRSLVRKWQTLIEANVTIKTADDYLVRLFVIGFTRKQPNQVAKATYARSSQIRAIRKRMIDIVSRETSTHNLQQLVKLVPEMGREIEKATEGIFPLQNVHVRKVKLLKQPKFDLGGLLALHGEASTDDKGQKVRKATPPLSFRSEIIPASFTIANEFYRLSANSRSKSLKLFKYFVGGPILF